MKTMYINIRYCMAFLIRLLAVIAVLVFIIQFSTKAVFAEGEAERDTIINEQADSSEIGIIEEQLNKYAHRDINELMPGYDPEKIIDDAAKGKYEFNITGLINRGLAYLFNEILTNMSILIKLVVIVILCAILKNLQSSFLGESVGELAFYACYVVVVSMAVISFNTVMNLGRDIVEKMVIFMQATIPVLITLLASGGNITSAGIFQPILIMVVEVAATLAKNIFLPLVFLSTILAIVDNVSDKIQISKLAGFLKQVSAWTLGLMLTVVVGIMAIQGSLGAVIDGVTSKTAKFAISAIIPVAGKYLADAADTVIGCTLLLKNAAGVAAMVGIIAICMLPFLKIAAIMALYRITCILIEPVSEKRIINCINEVANSMTYILGIVGAVSVMFLVSITAIISAGNISAMVR